METYDRVQRDDRIQQATAIAVFAYNAAMRDETLPRKAPNRIRESVVYSTHARNCPPLAW
jgi:hypothetical protein